MSAINDSINMPNIKWLCGDRELFVKSKNSSLSLFYVECCLSTHCGPRFYDYIHTNLIQMLENMTFEEGLEELVFLGPGKTQLQA